MRGKVLQMFGVLLTAIAVDVRPAVAQGVPAPRDGSYKVDAVRHRFFLHETGVLETEAVTQGRGWNAMLAAEAVLVLVDLAGPKFPVKETASLDMNATAGNAQLTHRWLSIQGKFFSEGQKTTVPFLVYGIGCESINIAVTLQIGTKRSTMVHVIPLACGE